MTTKRRNVPCAYHIFALTCRAGCRGDGTLSATTTAYPSICQEFGTLVSSLSTSTCILWKLNIANMPAPGAKSKPPIDNTVCSVSTLNELSASSSSLGAGTGTEKRVHGCWEKGRTAVATEVAGGQRVLGGVSLFGVCMSACSSSHCDGPVGVGAPAGPVCSGGAVMRCRSGILRLRGGY